MALSGDIETDASPFLPTGLFDDDPNIDGLKVELKRIDGSKNTLKRVLRTPVSALRSGGWHVDKTTSSNVKTQVDPVQRESRKMNESSGLNPPLESCVIVKRKPPHDILYLGELLVCERCIM